MRPLIFRELRPAWQELLPDSAFRGAFREDMTYPLRTFPGPGRNGVQNDLASVKLTRGGIRFPSWGQWRLIGGFGVLKVLLIDPRTPLDDVPAQVLAFAATNIWHSPVDQHLAHSGTTRSTFEFDRLADKFFRSDQPLGLHCGYGSQFLMVLLDFVGYRVRFGSLKTDSAGHLLPEVWLPQSKRWALVDPDFGVMLKHDGQWLSATDMVEIIAAGKSEEIEIVDIAGKPFSRRDVVYPAGFHGHWTWHPDHMDPKRPTSAAYRYNVFQRNFPPPIYHSITVSNEDDNTVLTSGQWDPAAEMKEQNG